MTITRMFAGQVNCGPVAMQIATGCSYGEIVNKWLGTWRGVSNDRGLFGLPNDAPMDHFATLEALSVPYQQVKCDDILNGNFTAEKTVLLLHLVEKPSNIIDKVLNFFRGTLHQHWVTLIGKSGDDFLIDWGYYCKRAGLIAPMKSAKVARNKARLKSF